MHITFGSCTSPTETFPFAYHPCDSPGMCAVDNFQGLRFVKLQFHRKYEKNNNKEKYSNGKKKKKTGGREERNEGGGGGGNRDRRDNHLSLIWSDAIRDEAYAIYNTLDLCFPDTKTNKIKITTTMMTDNVD